MITTLYFVQFAAFFLWQLTASRHRPVSTTGVRASLPANTRLTRLTGTALGLVACTGFVFQWGLAAGIAGFAVGLMGVGCLSVILTPFQYLRLPGVAAIYVCCLILELVI